MLRGFSTQRLKLLESHITNLYVANKCLVNARIETGKCESPEVCHPNFISHTAIHFTCESKFSPLGILKNRVDTIKSKLKNLKGFGRFVRLLSLKLQVTHCHIFDLEVECFRTGSLKLRRDY